MGSAGETAKENTVKPIQILTWAVSNADQADELIAEVSAVPAPSHPHFAEFVDAAYKPVKRLAAIADSFPPDALKSLPPEEEARRLATAEQNLRTFGDGKLLERLQKIIPIAMQLWQLWNQFKPV